MEALFLSPRKLSSGDLLIGVVASILAHILILFTALFLPGLMPRQSKQISFQTVNLVSINDLKDSFAPPLKGEKNATGKGSKAAPAKSSAKPSTGAAAKPSSPLVPVKRLQFDEAPKKSAESLKKLETAERPKIAAHTEKSDSIEKDLDKLTRKPKAASPAPSVAEPPKSSPPAKETTASTEETSTGQEAQPSRGAATEGKSEAAAGSPEGSPNGSAQAGAGGAQVALARRLYYTEIWNAIRSNWALPEFLKEKSLEAVLVVTIQRDGQILGLRFEKRSGNALFDDSAERAVRKSAPLPPFPAIYSPPQEEIGVRFRPEDLY